MLLRPGLASCALLAFALTTFSARADPGEGPPHGSRGGDGNSRGPGRGDGLGKQPDRGDDGPEVHGEGGRQGRGKGRGLGDGSGRAEPELTRDPIELSPLDELTFRPSAQYLLRYRHHEGQDFVPGGVTDTFRHRARLGLRATWRDKLAVKVTVQDVRFYGEELDTTADIAAEGIDLREAYAEFRPVEALRMRLGRQFVGWANERLIATRAWGEPQQAFDALTMRLDARGVHLEALYARVRDGSQPGAPGEEGDNAHVAGLHVDYQVHTALRPHVFIMTERSNDGRDRQHTAGVMLEGQLGRGLFEYSAEGYYQFGQAPSLNTSPGREVNYSASMFAVDATVNIPLAANPYIKLFGVFSSGDDDLGDNTITAFDNPYGARHKFWGEFDRFTQLRRDTDDRGLSDIASRVGVRPVKGMDIRATHHLFQAMAQRDGLEHFGHELDLAFYFGFWKYVKFNAVYALFVPGAIIANDRPGAVPEHFVYSTTSVTF